PLTENRRMTSSGSQPSDPNPHRGAADQASPSAPGTLLVRSPRALATLLEPPLILSTTPNLPGLLLALRRRWRLALFLGLALAAATAAGVWFTQTERHTARTLIHVASYQPYVFADATGNRTDFGSYQRTQVVLAKSRLVLNAALRDPKVADLPLVQEQTDP